MAEIEPGPDTPRWRAVIRYLTDNGSLRHKPPATSGPGQPKGAARRSYAAAGPSSSA